VAWKENCWSIDVEVICWDSALPAVAKDLMDSTVVVTTVGVDWRLLMWIWREVWAAHSRNVSVLWIAASASQMAAPWRSVKVWRSSQSRHGQGWVVAFWYACPMDDELASSFSPCLRVPGARLMVSASTSVADIVVVRLRWSALVTARTDPSETGSPALAHRVHRGSKRT
jgi:hypothetical protein